MKNEIKDLFQSMPGVSDDVMTQFIELLELPDEQFDVVYPIFKGQIANVYEGEEFQKNMLNQMKFYPIDDIMSEKEVVTKFLDEIYADNTLSTNKKELLGTMFNSSLAVFEELVASGRQSVKVKITKLNPDAIIPEYAHPTDAGADISAIEETTINAGETKLVKTGIAVAIPAGYEIQIRPRSGLSIKTGLRIPNTPGTIDTEYRGEICVPIWNTGETTYTIEKGMKIAQMLIAPTPMIKWDEVETIEELGITNRGANGFGSTDKVENVG